MHLRPLQHCRRRRHGRRRTSSWRRLPRGNLLYLDGALLRRLHALWHLLLLPRRPARSGGSRIGPWLYELVSEEVSVDRRPVLFGLIGSKEGETNKAMTGESNDKTTKKHVAIANVWSGRSGTRCADVRRSTCTYDRGGLSIVRTAARFAFSPAQNPSFVPRCLPLPRGNLLRLLLPSTYWAGSELRS